MSDEQQREPDAATEPVAGWPTTPQPPEPTRPEVSAPGDPASAPSTGSWAAPAPAPSQTPTWGAAPLPPDPAAAPGWTQAPGWNQDPGGTTAPGYPPPPGYAAPPGYPPPPGSPPPPGYSPPPGYPPPGYPPPGGGAAAPPAYGTAMPGVAGWGAVAMAPKPGVIPLRPLSVGEILDGAISYIRRDPKTVLGVSALIAAAIALVQLLVSGALASSLSDLTSSTLITSGSGSSDAQIESISRGTSGLFAVSGLLFLVTFLLGVLATGLLTTAMGRAVLGRRVTLGEIWERTRPRLLPLLGLTLLVGLIEGGALVVGLGAAVLLGVLLGKLSVGVGVLLGFAAAVAVVVTVLWLAIQLLLAPVALILESVGVTTALQRSFRLVRGAWWRTFGIYLLASILAQIVGSVLSVPFSFVGIASTLFSPGQGPSLILVSLSSAVGVLVSETVVIPFTAGVVALLYVDRRIRREALDIELARAASAAPMA